MKTRCPGVGERRIGACCQPVGFARSQSRHGRRLRLVDGRCVDACRLLQTRQVDVMLAGATDRTMDPATFAKFSAIGALSPSHSSPLMHEPTVS